MIAKNVQCLLSSTVIQLLELNRYTELDTCFLWFGYRFEQCNSDFEQRLSVFFWVGRHVDVWVQGLSSQGRTGYNSEELWGFGLSPQGRTDTTPKSFGVYARGRTGTTPKSFWIVVGTYNGTSSCADLLRRVWGTAPKRCVCTDILV
jgi:hypothetical protein